MQCMKKGSNYKVLLLRLPDWNAHFSRQNHIKCFKLSQSKVPFFFVGCFKCMADCLPPGGATAQSLSYIISCVAMAIQPAMQTLHPWQSSRWKYLATVGKSCSLLLSAICHLDSRRAEVKHWMPGKGEKKKQRTRRGENFTHTHTHRDHLHCNEALYCTFVSRTDIILSLASLTFSLFPHTLMWGSAGRKNKG